MKSTFTHIHIWPHCPGVAKSISSRVLKPHTGICMYFCVSVFPHMNTTTICVFSRESKLATLRPPVLLRNQEELAFPGASVQILHQLSGPFNSYRGNGKSTLSNKNHDRHKKYLHLNFQRFIIQLILKVVSRAAKISILHLKVCTFSWHTICKRTIGTERSPGPHQGFVKQEMCLKSQSNLPF